MAFYYYVNSGVNTLTATDQLPAYFASYAPAYQNSLEMSNGLYYPWNLPQNELVMQNDSFFSIGHTIPVEQVQSPTTTSEGAPQKKRRPEKTLEKEIISAKKNSQSNLINQFYSFFGSREKSEKTVERCCLLQKKTLEEADKILPLFYMAIRHINAKRGRKYVNAVMLLKFFTPEQFGTYLPEFKDRVDECSFVSLPELCQIFRRCTTYFLKNICVSAILTSKRISIISKEEHLKRRRKIFRTVLEN